VRAKNNKINIKIKKIQRQDPCFAWFLVLIKIILYIIFDTHKLYDII